MTSIRYAEEARDGAVAHFIQRLRQAWPEGSRVEFKITHGQKNPSRGEILHWHDGHTAIRLDSAKQAVKSIYWTYILSSPTNEP
jgi:hypothetical protein